MNWIEHMPCRVTKSVEAATFRDLCYRSSTRPLGVSEIKNREDLSLVVLGTRNSINCFDFICTNKKTITRHQAKHTDTSSDRYISRRTSY
jgi:4-hydroxy-3-methylbut-2-enyl diphosphate reductase IspH